VHQWTTSAVAALVYAHLFVKDDRLPKTIQVDLPDRADDPYDPIRCPQCGWRPTAADRWSCTWTGAPEPRFDACGTTWNTFATRGRCPGCSHQWMWTSCLRCAQWSLHEDWYHREP